MHLLKRALVALAASALVSACSLTIPMQRAAPSARAFDDSSAAKATLKVVDARTGDETKFHQLTGGLSRASVSISGMDAPVAVLAEELDKEFASRGYPVTVTSDAAARADLLLKVTRYRVVSHRSTGFSPWEAMHQFRGELSTGNRQQVIQAYFFNGKFPVWSMKEINGPCFDVPHSIVVKEIASKVNRAILGFQSTDAAVVALEERAEPKTSQDNGPYMELIELAGTNNPRAMPILKKYAKHKDEFVRAAALDAMGILGAKDELAFLKERYARLESLDRFMALKAIGDVGDDESLRFVADQASDRMYSSEEGMKFLVDLYSGK